MVWTISKNLPLNGAPDVITFEDLLEGVAQYYDTVQPFVCRRGLSFNKIRDVVNVSKLAAHIKSLEGEYVSGNLPQPTVGLHERINSTKDIITLEHIASLYFATYESSSPPEGFVFLMGTDGEGLTGSDGQQLYGAVA